MTATRERQADDPAGDVHGMLGGDLHSLVRKRDCGGPDPGSVSYAAFYPDLRAGSYTILRADGIPVGMVAITGSRVASWH